jgi:predicted DNA-binding protein (MmcQ/YjbR family)
MPSSKQIATQLRTAALAYPGAYEEHPWGESVAKVNKKVFVFLGRPENGDVGLSVKLPESGSAALTLPFATPTEYGLGKSGWVTARFEAGEDVPVALLLKWIRESYLAVAPVKLAAQLEGGAAPAKNAKKPARPAAPRKKRR